MKAGIYIIYNVINGLKYIGQSVNVKHRLELHKCDLKHNRHSNIHLQSAYNKYGKEGFVFKIVLNCEIFMLDALEIEYIKFFKSNSRGWGYNIEPGGLVNRKIPIEARKRMSEAKKGMTQPESAILQWKENRKGAGNQRARKVICTITQNIWDTAKQAAKENNINYSTLVNKLRGKDRNDTSLEYFHKVSASKIKIPVIDISTNKRWDDYSDAAIELNLNPGTLRKRLKGTKVNNTTLRLAL